MRVSTSNKTDRIRMPWNLLAIGFVFIFNPNITVVDVLPDFIGYIIICCALTNVAMICDTLSLAKKLFEKMILLDVGKYFAIAWVFGIETAAVRASSVLLWSFVFGTLEIVFLIPSYAKLFKGISELGDYYPNTSIHTAKNATGKSFTQRTRNFTVFFVIFKALMTVLPEFTDFNKNSNLLASNNENLYRYIGTIRLLFSIPVFVVGIIWAVSTVKYFLRIAKDKDFNNAIAEKYKRDVSAKKGIFAIKNVKIASWFMIAASFFSLDVIIDEINLLPDILVPIFLALAVGYFAKAARLRLQTTYVFLGIFSVF